MKQMGVRLQPFSIRGLELAQLVRLAFADVDRKIFVDKKVPDLFAFRPGVKRLVLGIADAAELRIGLEGLGAVAITDDLKDAFALVDLLAEHRPKIARFRTENLLPDRLVTQESKGVSRQLAATSQLAADSRNEDKRKRGHGAV